MSDVFIRTGQEGFEIFYGEEKVSTKGFLFEACYYAFGLAQGGRVVVEVGQIPNDKLFMISLDEVFGQVRSYLEGHLQALKALQDSD